MHAGWSASNAANRVLDTARLKTTAPSGPTAQTWKLPFAKSIAKILICDVIDMPSTKRI
jgi:hypothetical protein